MLQQFSSFRETLNPCVVVPAFLTLANLTAVSSKEKMQDLALKHTTCKSTRLQMGYFSSYGNGVGHMVWEVTDHPTDHSYHLQPPASVQSYSYPTHTTSSLWIFRGREPYKGTGPRHKHLHATRKKAFLCMSWFIAISWSHKGSIGSDSALAGTQVTQRSWKGSWGRRLLTSRALKTQPFPELYCHLPAAGSFPKAEPGEETKCSSAASVPNQLNLVKSPSAAVWAKHTDLTLKQESLPRAHPTRWHAALNSPGAPSPCVTPGILQAWTQQPSLCHPNIPALLSPS